MAANQVVNALQDGEIREHPTRIRSQNRAQKCAASTLLTNKAVWVVKILTDFKDTMSNILNKRVS